MCFHLNSSSWFLLLAPQQFEHVADSFEITCVYLDAAPLPSDAPALSAVTESDVETFLSPSGSVAARARKAHSEMLQTNRRPWWKTLGETANAGETSLTCPRETEVELGQREVTESE